MTDNNDVYETVEKIIKLSPRAIATHVGKFSHPNADASIYAQPRGNDDGFLRSGNASGTELDSPGNAATSDIAKFMLDKLEDGRSVYEHLREDTHEARQYLSIYGNDYPTMRAKLLKTLTIPKAEQPSSSELKQVYIPVEDNYHLLSLLVPAGIVMKMQEKLKEISESKSRQLGRLTTISYGGANAQNISYLATKLKGCGLLPCLPPQINKRVRLPKRDFFKEFLWAENYREIFNSFHKLQVADHNNEKIRQGRDRWVCHYFDRVVDAVAGLRAEEDGWSDGDAYKNLPSYQKKWLDNKYRAARDTSAFDIEASKIADDLVRQFIDGYERAVGREKVVLSDDFIVHVKNLIDIEGLR